MFVKLGLAILAMSAAVGAPVSAEAGSRLQLRLFTPQYYSPSPDDYYAGPLVAPRPRYYYLPDYEDEEDDVAYGYEPDYYEPEYEAPPKRKFRVKPQKPVVKQAKPAKPAARQAVKAAPKAKAKPVAAATTATPLKSSAKLITCSKATAIVTDYGFSNVTSTDCKGQAYAFTAARDGKPYVIKLSAVSGELMEVAKQ